MQKLTEACNLALGAFANLSARAPEAKRQLQILELKRIRPE